PRTAASGQRPLSCWRQPSGVGSPDGARLASSQRSPSRHTSTSRRTVLLPAVGSTVTSRWQAAVSTGCDGEPMHLIEGQPRLSATDLTTHLACAHATTLELERAHGQRPAPPTGGFEE